MTAPGLFLSRLRLSDFRSWRVLDASFDASLICIAGENGAGKTNLLEAISLLAPGRGLRGARMAALLDARGLRILAALDAIAANHETTQACVAIAWLLARGVTAPIASATSVAQLQQILPGATLSLSQEEVAALNASSATPA